MARSRRAGRVGDDTVMLQRSSIMIRNEDADLLELLEPEGTPAAEQWQQDRMLTDSSRIEEERWST